MLPVLVAFRHPLMIVGLTRPHRDTFSRLAVVRTVANGRTGERGAHFTVQWSPSLLDRSLCAAAAAVAVGKSIPAGRRRVAVRAQRFTVIHPPSLPSFLLSSVRPDGSAFSFSLSDFTSLSRTRPNESTGSFQENFDILRMAPGFALNSMSLRKRSNT